jgi:hypothetical protein
MSGYKTADILWELAEFANELLHESRQILNYHRASVYKDESSIALQKNSSQIRVIFNILGDDMLQEIFSDIDVFTLAEVQKGPPGESLLTLRLGHLIREGLPAIEMFQKRIIKDRRSLDQNRIDALIERRRELLSVCKQGSRSWELLKSIA